MHIVEISMGVHAHSIFQDVDSRSGRSSVLLDILAGQSSCNAGEHFSKVTASLLFCFVLSARQQRYPDNQSAAPKSLSIRDAVAVYNLVTIAARLLNHHLS